MKESKKFNFDIFLNPLYIKNTATVNPTNNNAAGPYVSKANPKKKPASIAVLYPKFPIGLFVCFIKLFTDKKINKLNQGSIMPLLKNKCSYRPIFAIFYVGIQNFMLIQNLT